jgi:hypothetical protein
MRPHTTTTAATAAAVKGYCAADIDRDAIHLQQRRQQQQQISTTTTTISTTTTTTSANGLGHTVFKYRSLHTVLCCALLCLQPSVMTAATVVAV